MENTIKAYSYEELVVLLADLKQPRFRADQIVQWLYARGVQDYQEMSNIPRSLIKTLEDRFPLASPSVINQQVSFDGTQKYVLSFHDNTQAETVAIPSRLSSNDSSQKKNGVTQDSQEKEVGSGQRLTVCVSTQVGCAMDCSFCATGKEGFTRNLLPGEIVDQVLIAQKHMNTRVSNVVTMGQGEPFLNYKNTLSALRLLNSPKGLAIGARHMTISSCGITKGIRMLAEEPEQFTLAVSLHSAEQKIRNSLMPRMANEPLEALKKALLEYVKKTNRRVSLEYLMLNGINDTPKALKALLSFCKGLLCHINLLPINTIEGSAYTPSPASKAWMQQIEKAHIPVTIRNSRGSDIAGACGQLKNSL